MDFKFKDLPYERPDIDAFEKTAAELYVLPVFISGGEVKLFIMPE